MNRVLAELEMEDYFHATRCADETRSKPDPLMLHELLAHFDLAPGQACMVGDTEFDMAMAQRAGVGRLGVSYGAHSAERLRRYDLLGCLDRLSEIFDYLAV